MKEQASIPAVYGTYDGNYTSVVIEKPQIYHYGPWAIVTGGHFDVVVYGADGRYLETVRRKCEPMAPFGPWTVWRFSYKGKKYSSLVDVIWGFLTVNLAK